MKIKNLPRSTPAQQGVNPKSIIAFLDAIKQDHLELHSMMIVKNGSVIAEGWWEPYRSEYPHQVNSLSKCFTATAIGLAIDEGHLTLDDPVISFFPEFMTEQISNNLKDLSVKHLLSMSTGHDQNTTPILRSSDRSWVETFLNIPLVYEPGTHFLYNTGASYMLSAILYKATGKHLLHYLQPRLLDPLNIEDVTTLTCPDGIHAGGYGMHMKTEDIAKLGLLYLQNGIWNDQRILSESWIKSATSKQVDTRHAGKGDWSLGYGFQFWRCPHNAYRGDGAFGQYCIVLPEQQAVIVMTAGIKKLEPHLNHVWTYLLPGMTDPVSSEQIATQQILEQRLQSLSHLLQPSEQDGTKRIERTVYTLDANEVNLTHITFIPTDQSITIEFRNEQESQWIQIGYNHFLEGTTLLNGYEFQYAACGAWHNQNFLEISLFMTEYAISDQILCHFDHQRVQVSFIRNVGAKSVLSNMGALPTLTGTRS